MRPLSPVPSGGGGAPGALGLGGGGLGSAASLGSNPSLSRPLSSGGLSGTGSARPGPPVAQASLQASLEAGARDPSFVLPHSTARAALPLPAGGPAPPMVGASALMSEDEIASLAAALPPIHQGAEWSLVYSTGRDGTSLHTLLRKAAGAAPALLVVRDGGGAVFGAYTAEAWHVAPRFFGSGETFVFQLHPRRAAYPWAQAPGLQNDFFQFVGPDGLGVGGSGHWALFLDEELLRGSSGECATFASPCLGCEEDFEVLGVELWRVH
ncbi:MAG: TLD-domain-containing protein [Monoraphidium minutum]|nr:MAG: TLD-domain-containing protein [Monoraphidium minutum]